MSNVRIFAISDLHVDYRQNREWVRSLSDHELQEDVLLLAGDVSDDEVLLASYLTLLARKFKKVLFVPGNPDIWVRGAPQLTSLDKLARVLTIAQDCGVLTQAYRVGATRILPLLAWYDYSFGPPGTQLRSVWLDYASCRWPAGRNADAVTQHFLEKNLAPSRAVPAADVTFSHFLPRIDVMPAAIPEHMRFLCPVLGTTRLDAQIRACGSRTHVYGHSHVNRRLEIGGVEYVNNAFGYPKEDRIASKKLLCVHTEHV